MAASRMVDRHAAGGFGRASAVRITAPATLLLLAASLLFASHVTAQVRRPPMFLVPCGDSVVVLLTEEPPLFGGFVLYRSTPGGEPVRITPQPIVRMRDPTVAAHHLGDDAVAVRRAVRAADDAEMMRRLRSDPFASVVVSGLFPRAGQMLGRTYVDTALTPGSTYEYRLVYTDGSGKETTRRLTGRVRLVQTPPGAPANVEVEPGDHSATLGWSYKPYRGDSLDFVIGFHVYRRSDASAAFERVSTSPLIRDDARPQTYLDEELREGTTYRYHVRAIDLAGREGAPSPVVEVTIADRTPPGRPEDVVATGMPDAARVTWRISPEPDVVGYHVERSTGLDKPYTRLTNAMVETNTPWYADTTVASRTQVFYRVIAFDSVGNESVPSNSASALPLDRGAPPPPPNVQVKPLERRLVVSWSKPDAPDVLGYFVYRGDDTAKVVRLMREPIPELMYTDSGAPGMGLRPGGKYVVMVSAVDSSRNESEKVLAEVLVPDDQPPPPPSAFTARNVDGRYIELVWSAAATYDAKEYVIARADSGSAEITAVATITAGSAWMLRDSAVVRGRTYIYLATTIDSAGNRSEPAADTVRSRDGTPPPAPRYAAARITGTGIVITWERVVDDELAGYVVYRSTIPTGGWERITPTPLSVLTHTDASGKAEYFYQVRAVDRSGNESRPAPLAQCAR